MSIFDDKTRLENAKAGFRTWLTEGGVAVPEGAKIDEMVGLLDGVETGADTSDATATADDMAKGKTAYVNGEKVTGTLPVYGSYSEYAREHYVSGDYLCARSNVSSKRILNAGTKNAQIMTHMATTFGDATAADVVEGKTFTSGAGLKVVGTKVEEGIERIVENLSSGSLDVYYSGTSGAVLLYPRMTISARSLVYDYSLPDGVTYGNRRMTYTSGAYQYTRVFAIVVSGLTQKATVSLSTSTNGTTTTVSLVIEYV